jgi:uncharacterized protein YpmB
MKKVLLLVTLLVLVAFVSGVVAIRKPAPEPAPEAPASTVPGKPMMEKTEKFSGVIEKVDQKGKIIVVKGNMTKEEKTLTFIMDDRTKITQGKTSMTIGDLKKDMQVSVEYKREMNRMIAVAIEVSVPKNAPRKK